MDIEYDLFKLQVIAEGEALMDSHSLDWKEGFLIGCQFITDYFKERTALNTVEIQNETNNQAGKLLP